MTPLDLRHYGNVTKSTFYEIVEKIREIYIEEQTKPDDNNVFLFRRGKEFVADVLHKEKFPVPEKALEIAEAYRNTKLTGKKVREAVEKIINGEELSFNEQVLYVKALEKFDKYIDIFFNLLSLERIPEKYLLSPSQALKFKLPLPAFKFKKALSEKMKPLEGKFFPANAVLFLLTDFNVPEHILPDKYLFLDRTTVGLIHDDEELRNFPFREKLDEKLLSVVKENEEFYILKQEIIINQYLCFTISPAEFYAVVKSNTFPPVIKDRPELKEKFFDEIVKKRYPDSPYLKKIGVLIKKTSKTGKMPSV